jgi:hypothetical protein
MDSTAPRVLRSESTAPLTFVQFTQTMESRFGVKWVYKVTKAQQAAWLGVPPEELRDWQAWDPGNSSSVYNAIIDSLDAFSATFGGHPLVSAVAFAHTRYVRDGKAGAVRDTEAAMEWKSGKVGETPYHLLAIYGGGLMSSGRKSLPIARSEPGAKYPVVLSTDPGPGAPVAPATSHAESQKRFALHELGHGLARVLPKTIDEYASAVGWTGTGDAAVLYDKGAPAVQQARANGAPPAEEHRITPSDWNDPKWVEQPLSKYAVSGGPGEDFAETIMAYVEDEALVKARSPIRHAFIEGRKSLWQPLLEPQPVGLESQTEPATPAPGP